MVVRCRCSSSRCRRRRTLAHPPGWYKRQHFAACTFCSAPLTVDRHRTSGREQQKALDTGRTCTCDGYEWPHTRGTLPNCAYREAHEEKAVEALLEASLRGALPNVYCDGEPPF